MQRGFKKANFDLTLSRLFSNAARYAIITFAVIGVLATFGIETSSFAAIIAAMGLAVGLAFQGTLGNFAAGMMLRAAEAMAQVPGVRDRISTATAGLDATISDLRAAIERLGGLDGEVTLSEAPPKAG